MWLPLESLTVFVLANGKGNNNISSFDSLIDVLKTLYDALGYPYAAPLVLNPASDKEPVTLSIAEDAPELIEI